MTALTARICAALICLIWMSGPAASDIAAPPAYYQVTGVAAGDTLNVRLGPSGKADILGELAPGAQPIEITATTPDGRWGRMPYFGDDGWVSMRYLSPIEVAFVSNNGRQTGVPIGLNCGGTEPFWGLEIVDTDGVVLSTPDDGRVHYRIERAHIAAGYQSMPASLELVGETGKLLATFSNAACSDGMSDQTYGYALTVFAQQGERRYLLGGCCNLRVAE
ncbi:MAG: SH3 domain-containing protein [Pseudomonadota bacterium]